MISRYSRAEMSQIWTDENRFKIWLEVESLALEQMANEGIVPKEAVNDLRSKANFNVERVFEIEKEVKHDVIAFLTNVAEYVGPSSRYVHRGMTSSDVLDTSFAVQLKTSGELIRKDIEQVLESIKKRAIEYKQTACIGRSHGIHAEPVTFGLKLAGWYAEMKRQLRRLDMAIEDISYGKIAGAVGTYQSVSPSVEKYVLDNLKLKPETVATQIVQRDRHAFFFSVLAQIACSIERFVVEVRHLQRTEVREVEEQFTKGQKGSSAMPHKRNPILSENLTGMARLLRGYAGMALENVALWHERDISHSSVERVIAPDACIVCDFMLQRFNTLVSGMVIYEERMQENLDFSRGLIFSGTLLITLADYGISREQAYSLVQEHALATWEGGDNFQARVLADERITKLVPEKKLQEVFDIKRHLQHVDFIFERAMNS